MPTDKPDPEGTPSSLPDNNNPHASDPRADKNDGVFSVPSQGREEREAATQRTRSIENGKYKLLQKIGSGGMGEVWMADQTKPVRRRVAVKLIKSGLDNEQVTARFEAERQALAMMDHQCIAKVLDAGSTIDGLPYFVMELVQGIPITKYCDSSRLSLEERLGLFAEVCSAVQHAHQKGIIHRDIKPSNILVTLYDGKPVPKVIDFGLAKALEHQTRLTDRTLFTEFGQIVGTLQYMSPEQAEMNALDVDTRTDVYSLGVLLYELLTGSTPIDADTVAKQAIVKVLESIREKDPPRPSERLSNSREAIAGISLQRRIEPKKLRQLLRGDLDWIVMKSLEKDRRRRYETANGLAEDIRRFLTDQPIAARPPSRAYQIQRFARKHRGLVVSLTAIFMLLVLGIFGTSLFAWRARVAEAQAIIDRDNAKASQQIAQQERVTAEQARTKAIEQETAATEARKLAEEKSQQAEAARVATEGILAKSNLIVANSRLKEHRVSEAKQVLHSIPEKFRNLEWSMANREIAGSDITLYGHTSWVTAVEYSPDGTRLVSSSWDGTIKFWDAVTGLEQLSIPFHQNSVVFDVKFFPNGDRIAACGETGLVKIFDARSGALLDQLQTDAQKIGAIAINPQSNQLAVDVGSVIQIWNPDSKEMSAQFESIETYDRNNLMFSSNGKELGLKSRGRTAVKIWRCDNWDALTFLFDANPVDFAFGPTGDVLLSDQRGNTWVKDLVDLNTTHFHKLPITKWPTLLEYSPAGSTIVCVDGEDIVVIDTKDFDQIHRLVGHEKAIQSVSFSPDSQRLASGSEDGTIKIWDLRSGSHRSIVNAGLSPSSLGALGQSIVPPLAISPNNEVIAHTNGFSEVALRNVRDNVVLKKLRAHEAEITAVRFNKNGEILATGGADGTIALFDVASGSLIRQLFGHQLPVTDFDFNSNSSELVSASSDGTIRIWHLATGMERLARSVGPCKAIAVRFHRDDKSLFVLSHDELEEWQAADGQFERRQLIDNIANGFETAETMVTSEARDIIGVPLVSRNNTPGRVQFLSRESKGFELLEREYVTSLCLVDNETRLLSVSTNGLAIWDLDSGNELARYPLPSFARSAAIVSGSSDLIAIQSDNYNPANTSNELTLWHCPRASEIQVFSFSGYPVEFSTDNRSLLTFDANEKQLLRSWSLDLRSEIELIEPKKIMPEQLHYRGYAPAAISSNRRYSAFGYTGNSVLIQDSSFRDQEYQRRYRAAKAKTDPLWQAQQGSRAWDWWNESHDVRALHAAVSHLAQALVASPGDMLVFEKFHHALAQWNTVVASKQHDTALGGSPTSRVVVDASAISKGTVLEPHQSYEVLQRPVDDELRKSAEDRFPFQCSMFYFRKGDFQDCIRLLEHRLDSGTIGVGSLRLLAHAYAELGQYEDAAKAFDELCTRTRYSNPKDGLSYLRIALKIDSEPHRQRSFAKLTATASQLLDDQSAENLARVMLMLPQSAIEEIGKSVSNWETWKHHFSYEEPKNWLHPITQILLGKPVSLSELPTQEFDPWRYHFLALSKQNAGEFEAASAFAAKSKRALALLAVKRMASPGYRKPDSWEMKLDAEDLRTANNKLWPMANSSELLQSVDLPDFTSPVDLPQTTKVASNAAVASWSPGSVRLAYGMLPNGGIAVLNLQTKESTVIHNSGKDPCWSPNGRYIAFVENDVPHEEIWIVEPDGGNARCLGKGGYPSWSSDGKILFFRVIDPRTQVMSIEVDAAGAEPQVAFNVDGLSYYPAVSPDGSLVAFHSAAGLAVVDRLGMQKFTVPLKNWNGCLPSWSPDGRFVCFGSYGADRGGSDSRGCWLLDITTGIHQQIIKGPVTKVAWTNDGTQIAFDVRGSTNQIFILLTEYFYSPK